VVEIAKQERKPIIFELDDLLFFLPGNHPDRLGQYFAPSLLPMFQALMEADLVTVPTRKLQEALANFNQNVVVLPNYLDDNLWHLTPPILKDSSREILTIGYMGTNSHQPDLYYITPVLLDLIKRYPQKIRFHFWGVQPPAELGSLPQVQWTPWYSHSYNEFAAFFQTQSADIFIAPLVDNLFNRCKSPLKFFEFSALGAPGVYSRLEPYEEVITHERDGLEASSLGEWRDCLIQLIENDNLRFELATHAQATIKENWLLSQNAFRWNEILQSTFDVTKSNREQDTHIVSMVGSINLQLFETFQALTARATEQDQVIKTLDRSAKTLTVQLSQARNELEQSRAEVLKYALSRSWQITRPLRKIKKKIFGRH
jgi:glycosyltransferase involved in cell wall biosynthesis